MKKLLLLTVLLVSQVWAETNLVWRPSSTTNRDQGTWQFASADTLVLQGTSPNSNYTTAPIVRFDAVPAAGYVFACRADRQVGAGSGCPAPGDWSQEGFIPKSQAAVPVVTPPPPPPPEDPPTFQVRRPSCYIPPLDWHVGSLPDNRRMLVWWCRASDGTERNARVEDAPHSVSLDLTDENSDALWSIDSVKVTRGFTAEEQAFVENVERVHGPRCFVRSTSSTAVDVPVYPFVNGVRQTTPRTMRVAVGTWTTCDGGTFGSTASSLYCRVDNVLDTLGRPIPPGSVALCEIRKAASAGWPQ